MRQGPRNRPALHPAKQCRSQPDLVIRPGTTANALHFASESKPPPRVRHMPPCIRSRSASLRKAAHSRILRPSTSDSCTSLPEMQPANQIRQSDMRELPGDQGGRNWRVPAGSACRPRTGLPPPADSLDPGIPCHGRMRLRTADVFRCRPGPRTRTDGGRRVKAPPASLPRLRQHAAGPKTGSRATPTQAPAFPAAPAAARDESVPAALAPAP